MISFSSFFAIFASKFIYMQEIKKISDYRLSLKDRIVEESILAFASRGIKAVKMDDIRAIMQWTCFSPYIICVWRN